MEKYKLTSKCDFSDGVKVKSSDIKQWKEEIFDAFNEQKDIKFQFIRSGNSAVIGLRYKSGNITIFEVTNGYESFEYENTNER